MRTLGIILAAGKSTRLYPSTLVTTKQLLPIYDKPLIYYPLTTLMLAGIRDVIIIASPNELATFQRLFSDSQNEMGINVTLLVQEKPIGIADAFNVTGNFLGQKIFDYDNHALILGDNIFYGAGLRGLLEDAVKETRKASIFLYPVQNPREFGVAELDGNIVVSVEEKPINPKSNLAVTGLYIYPTSVYLYTSMLQPSKRGELEITDLNADYLRRKELIAHTLSRGTVWFDTGNPDAMLEASNFIQNIQKHQNYIIGSPHEVSISRNWVTKESIAPFIEKCSKTKYGKYLKQHLGESV